ncbi:hypothetical protein DL96DRAFT_1489644 [Flagelloscypha sp. PMI_526]|nr:hypothetical protein DL96DRAFT_1489644 [Flagelloscypha sp. PMI_526]
MTSPARKRMRLSSPTFDEHFETSQDDLDAFDAIMRSSQQPIPMSQPHFAPASEFKPSLFAPASQLKLGMASNIFEAADGGKDDDDDYNDSVPEKDYESWFEADTGPSAATFGFQSASFTVGSAIQPVSGFQSASIISNTSDFKDAVVTSSQPTVPLGFASARGASNIFQPSIAALTKEKQKMKEIWSENPQPPSPSPISPRKRKENFAPPSPHTPPPPSRALPLHTPSPQKDSAASSHHLSSASEILPTQKSRPFKTLHPTLSQNLRGFRSPLLSNASPSIPSPSQHVPQSSQPAPPQASPSSILPSHPKHAALLLPRRGNDSTSFYSPVKKLGMSSRRNVSPARFNSPMKPGWKPPESQLPRSKLSSVITATARVPQANRRTPVFDLSIPSERSTLKSSGLVPCKHSVEELHSMGIDLETLSQITPTTAQYYKFNTPQCSLSGPDQVLEFLLSKECSFARKDWVENHWTWILWKLAAMVTLDPKSEADINTRRWRWEEVLKQYLYRYEREVNQGIRPALRKIATQDAPSTVPITLVVARVHYPETLSRDAEQQEEYIMEPTRPELDVSDGWYQIRAAVDESLARAIRRGVIRVGKKITVAGAKLDLASKEPKEILESYDSAKLILSGNSTHPACWHAKLGFQKEPNVSALRSLNPDGGVVSMLHVVIMKVYPFAFLETKEDEDGNMYREGPRTEADESKEHDHWQKRKADEEAKLWEVKQKEWDRLESYVERLEEKARPCGEDDSCPDHIDALYDQLGDLAQAKQAVARVSTADAWWLSRCIRQKLEREREAAYEDITREVSHTCPPRQVMGFRVLLVKDAVVGSKPSNRVASITVWNAKAVNLYEGSPGGSFEVGHSFMISNLFPSQPSAWMGRDDPESQIFLVTGNGTTWRRTAI